MKWNFVTRPLSRVAAKAICFVTLMHLCQASIMVIWPISAGATDMIAMLRWAVFGYGLAALIPLMIITILLALTGLVFRVGWLRILTFIPQQLLLGIMAFGGIAAALNGAYLDGTVIPWPHILNDQLGYITLFSIHFCAIIRRSKEPDD